jgi:hypothetical protein
VTRPARIDRSDLAVAVSYLAAELEGNDPWWDSWDEDRDGPDPDRAAIARVVELVRTALEDGAALEVEAGRE